MKYPRFEYLGAQYPHALENRFDRILGKIDELWDSPAANAFFDDLVLDRRGGRQGFPKDVLEDILRLRDEHAAQALRVEMQKEAALKELMRQGLAPTQRDFVRAVQSGQQALVDLFLQAGVSIHTTDEEGTPVLIMAMKAGYSIIANLLVRAGADVHTTDKWGISPLQLACGKNTAGFRAIAEALVKRGAPVNVRDPLGYTPLLLALSGGTADVAEMLVAHGAEVNVRTRDGKTPLALAKAAGNEHIVQLLIEKGATD